MIRIRSPKFEQAEIPVPPNVAQLHMPFNGEICSTKGECFPIKSNIIDLLEDELKKLSPAEYSNHFDLTASSYEDLWRKRSLSILTGQDFPIEREIKYLIDWLEPKPNQTIIDLGCSSALYARKIKRHQPACDVIGLDFSKPMLKEAYKRAKAEEVELYLIRANAKSLPFFAHEIDSIACGGTLNEFSDPRKVMYECRRVLKTGGKFFLMHLLEAETWYGKILQASAKAGGINFWSRTKVNQLFESTGFSIKNQHREGIVCFTLLEASDD